MTVLWLTHRKRLQMAYSTTVQGGWDALE